LIKLASDDDTAKEIYGRDSILPNVDDIVDILEKFFDLEVDSDNNL